MKKIKLFAASCIAATLFFFACKKENNNQPPFQSQSTHTAAKGSCTPDNPDNNFDNAGQVHNAGLGAVLPQNGTMGNYNITDQQMFINLTDWATNLFGTVTPNLQDQVNTIVQDAPNLYYNVIEQANLSAVAKTYAHNFTNLLTNTSNYPDPQAITYCQLKDRIMTYEKTIMDADDLTDQEKQILLQSTSIARYSAYYGWNHIEATPPVTTNPTQYGRIIGTVCSDWSTFTSTWDFGCAVGVSCAVYKYGWL